MECRHEITSTYVIRISVFLLDMNLDNIDTSYGIPLRDISKLLLLILQKMQSKHHQSSINGTVWPVFKYQMSMAWHSLQRDIKIRMISKNAM